MRRVLETVDFFPFQINVAVDQIVREYVALGQEVTVRVKRF